MAPTEATRTAAAAPDEANVCVHEYSKRGAFEYATATSASTATAAAARTAEETRTA